MQELISRQLVRYLEERGVEHVFGLCGHTNIAVLTELGKSAIRFVNTRHIHQHLRARQQHGWKIWITSLCLIQKRQRVRLHIERTKVPRKRQQ